GARNRVAELHNNAVRQTVDQLRNRSKITAVMYSVQRRAVRSHLPAAVDRRARAHRQAMCIKPANGAARPHGSTSRAATPPIVQVYSAVVALPAVAEQRSATETTIVHRQHTEVDKLNNFYLY